MILAFIDPHGICKLTSEFFEKYYINPQRLLTPASENTIKLTLTNDKPFPRAPHGLSYNETAKL